MRRLLLGLLLAASFAAPAQAALIRYDFSGTLNTGDIGSAFAAPSGLATGTGTFSGYAVFDSDFNLGSAVTEVYNSGDFQLQIGSFIFSSANPGVDSATAVIDSSGLFQLSFGSGQDLTAGDLDAMNMSILFSTATSGLEQNPDVTTESFFLSFTNDDPDFLIATGDVTQFATSAIPEPATWTMLIGGFGLLGAALRFRRRQPSVRLA